MDEQALFSPCFYWYEDSGLERSQSFSYSSTPQKNFCCLCLFHFPHRLVLCCFMYVSLVVSSMWFLCLSASYLFVSSLALLLFSLPRLPAISPPRSHPHSISFSFLSPPLLPSHSLSPPPPSSFPLRTPFSLSFLILAALPAADDWSRFSRFALSCYLAGNVYAQFSVLQSQLACVHTVFVVPACTYSCLTHIHFFFFFWF